MSRNYLQSEQFRQDDARWRAAEEAEAARRACLTPRAIYNMTTNANGVGVFVSLPVQLGGLLDHLFAECEALPPLGRAYEDVLHDALAPAIARIIAANAAYENVRGNIGPGRGYGPIARRAQAAALSALEAERTATGSPCHAGGGSASERANPENGSA